ncbi:MAG TPA: zinc-binding alcohol dehydrogenase family protein [Candidatus Sulfotelmatobacter sp.]|nr:zinc-binding alcohol dehydrogenase family protein [Candidatus Sulfotelmatobacter sp.]
MKQIVLERPGSIVGIEADIPTPGPGEALLRVHRVGVCGTDFHAFHGRQAFFTYPRIMGHELAAEIVQVPANDRGLAVGDRCTVEPYLNCGACRPCREGYYNNCENIRVMGVHTDGGMREFVPVPMDHVYNSSRLSFDQLAVVEPLSIGAQAVMRSKLTAGESLVVVGAGPIGVAITQLALAAGARVRVIEKAEHRRKQIEILNVEVVAETEDESADVVIDATGNAESMARAFSRARFGGRVVWVGIVPVAVPVDDPLFHHRELTLYASRNSAGHFPRIIQMIEDGVIDTSLWITQRLGLNEVPERFEDVTTHKGLKTVIDVT